MSSYSPARDAKQDALISPENSAFIIIDYQPVQVNSINSMIRSELISNIVTVCQLAVDYKLPIVLSTVNVKTGKNAETISPILEVLKGIPSYDRTSINAWEDKDFNEAVKATGRKKLLMAALWTEACLTFPTLDALREGFQVYPIVDAVGGTSLTAHEVALRRVEQAGAQLASVSQLACELQRDWARSATAPFMVRALQSNGSFLKT
ncbi:MAG: hydrolase [Sphingobacteriales bacterium 50-39]|nr:isochorismatase family protein [Sphingobacteriales bacterium]OJW58622.1 MAG: hydrolase [Sphingobacteriales bacterium 50-39]